MDYKEFDPKPKKLTRPQAFADSIKEHKVKLFVMGLLLCLSAVPVVTFRFLVVLHKNETLSAVKNGTLSEQEAFLSVNSLENMFFISSFVLIIPVVLILAGICKTVKIISWREKFFARECFGEGIKENFLSLLFSAEFNLCFLWCVNLVEKTEFQNSLFSFLPLASYFLLILPWSFWTVSSSSVYKGTVFTAIKNSFVFTVKTYPFSIVMTAVLILPLAGNLIGNVYAQLGFPFVFAVYFPFSYLAWVHFTNENFDKHINISLFPELVGKGLE